MGKEQNEKDSNAELTAMHSDHLSKMIMNAGQLSIAWLKFFITVQAALAVGFGYLATACNRSVIQMALAALVCLAALGLAWGISEVIARHHQWQAWFIRWYVALPGNQERVFPTASNEPSRIDPGNNGGLLRNLGRIFQSVFQRVFMGAPKKVSPDEISKTDAGHNAEVMQSLLPLIYLLWVIAFFLVFLPPSACPPEKSRAGWNQTIGTLMGEV